MIDPRPTWRRFGALALGIVCLLPDPGWPIETQPGQARIEAALEAGRAAAAARTPPDRLYAWFGSTDDLQPRGFLLSKLVGLKVMGAHFALRGATPGESDIRQILEEPSLLISITIFGERPGFAVDSYMVLMQGGKLVKPLRVRFDGQAQRTRAWPQQPAYQAKVVASFAYADLDPQAPTRVAVYPAGGGEVSFDVDFRQIE